MTVLSELSKNQTVLLVMSNTKYNDRITDIAKQLSKKNVCYITYNKTYAAIKDTFKKKKISSKNTVFIDAISSSLTTSEKQTDTCYFLPSPGALTELSILITKFMRHKFDYIIFDSITNLLIYRDKKTVEKFLMSVINKVKTNNAKAVFYAIDIKEHEPLIKSVSMFVDKVLEEK